MGFFGAIKGFFKSKLGKIITIGAGVAAACLIPGVGPFVTKGLASIAKLTKLGKVGSALKGAFAKYMDKREAFMSKTGLKTVETAAKHARSVREVANVAKAVNFIDRDVANTDRDVQENVTRAGRANLGEVYARHHARAMAGTVEA